MKLVRSLLSLLLILLNLTLLCGCWNYQDVEKMLLVSGVAIDKNEQGDLYIITVEVVDFEMAGSQAKQVSKFVESEGETVFDAIRNSIDIIGKKLYWAHANIVIISQDIAKEGIIQIIDFLVRDAEVKEEGYIMVSKEKTAKEVLKQEMLLPQTSSNSIDNMLNNQINVGTAYAIKSYEIVSLLEYDGISMVLPAIHLTKSSDKKTAEMDGSAVFKSDKLVGFLNNEETKSFLFIMNNIKGGLITLKEPSSSHRDTISLEIYKSKTKVKPKFSDKKLTMDINIKTEVAISEVGTSVDYINEKRDKLKKDAEKELKASVEKVIKKVQNEFDSDIFGFGMATKAYMPSVWRNAQQKGNNLFKELKPNIEVELIINNSALTSKVIKKGD